MRLLALILAATLLAAPLAASATQETSAPNAPTEVKLPDTPAARLFGKFFAAQQSGDLAALRDFFKAHQPGVDPDDAVAQQVQIRNQSGGFDLVSIDPRSTQEMILVKTRSRNSGREVQQFIALKPGSDQIRVGGMADGGYDMSRILEEPKP